MSIGTAGGADQLVAPYRQLGPAPDRVTADVGSPATSGRVLLCSSNGGGLGHLTRLMAVARRLPPSVDAVFVTMSHGVPLITREGYTAEYIPTAASMNADPGTWNDYLRARMHALVDHYRPDVLVYDGVSLYQGLLDSWRACDDLRRVWLRRAMWRPGTVVPAGHGEVFDLILEPGDIAATGDIGATTLDRDVMRRVDPIVHLDERELLSRDAARAALGLAADRRAALLTLGAGNINDIGTTAGRIAATLRASGDVAVVMLRSPIAAAPAASVAPDGVAVRSVYPVSRYLRAFDMAFSAAGYNSFHELIAFAVPTVFVPNEYTVVDDQAARARFAEWAGAGLAVSDWSTDELVDRVRAVLDPRMRSHLAHNSAAVFPGNGAADAATVLARLALTRGPAARSSAGEAVRTTMGR